MFYARVPLAPCSGPVLEVGVNEPRFQPPSAVSTQKSVSKSQRNTSPFTSSCAVTRRQFHTTPAHTITLIRCGIMRQNLVAPRVIYWVLQWGDECMFSPFEQSRTSMRISSNATSPWSSTKLVPPRIAFKTTRLMPALIGTSCVSQL